VFLRFDTNLATRVFQPHLSTIAKSQRLWFRWSRRCQRWT